MSGLLTNNSGQVLVEFDPLDPATTATVQALTLIPGIEGARKARGRVLINGTDTFEFTITYHDIAFEEFGLYGDRLTADARKRSAQRY